MVGCTDAQGNHSPYNQHDAHHMDFQYIRPVIIYSTNTKLISFIILVNDIKSYQTLPYQTLPYQTLPYILFTIYYKMGSGYSIVDGNVQISEERMKTIYSAYCKPDTYAIWKKQLEKQSETAAKTKKETASSKCDISSSIIQ